MFRRHQEEVGLKEKVGRCYDGTPLKGLPAKWLYKTIAVDERRNFGDVPKYFQIHLRSRKTLNV